jgi:hypothetical protein
MSNTHPEEKKKTNTAVIVVNFILGLAVIGGIIWFVIYRKRTGQAYPSTWQAVTGQYAPQ